jgi:hypothetical protein
MLIFAATIVAASQWNAQQPFFGVKRDVLKYRVIVNIPVELRRMECR